MKYSVKNASITLEANTILDYVNFEINDYDHIGIVGRNGAGKTTLLKALIDNDFFDEGYEDEPFEIRKQGNFHIGYQSQITLDDDDRSLYDEVKDSFKNLIDLEKRIEELSRRMEENLSDRSIEEYTNLLEQYEYLGGYTYKKEIEVMLKKFGFKDSEKNRTIKSFSGGERTKIALLKLLLSKPDILFLDEPTNHLDLDAIEWLEEYLKNYPKAFVLVSHDRMFLNNTVDIIYEVGNNRTTKYIGNYEMYEKLREEEYARNLKNYERQEKEIKRLRALYEKFRKKPTKAKMALSKLHMIERMDIIDKPERRDTRVFKTKLDNIDVPSRVVLKCKNLSIGYNHELAHLNLEIEHGERVGIIGPNGTGKSTFLKTITGKIAPQKGSVAYGYNVKPAYFDQTLAMEDSKNTVLKEFMDAHPELLQEEARTALGSFLFKGDDVFKTIDVLSGGERVRLSLCKILYDKPNVLILDEPTNHMDILGKKHLEDILSMYKGTIIFVTHDRYFVKKIATKLIVFDHDGATIYPYGYDEYVSRKENLESVDIQKTPAPKIQDRHKTKTTTNIYSAKKELNSLEKEIGSLEKEKKSLEEELENPNIYTDYKKSHEINSSLKKIEERLKNLYDKWERFTDEILKEE